MDIKDNNLTAERLKILETARKTKAELNKFLNQTEYIIRLEEERLKEGSDRLIKTRSSPSITSSGNSSDNRLINTISLPSSFTSSPPPPPPADSAAPPPPPPSIPTTPAPTIDEIRRSTEAYEAKEARAAEAARATASSFTEGPGKVASPQPPPPPIPTTHSAPPPPPSSAITAASPHEELMAKIKARPTLRHAEGQQHEEKEVSDLQRTLNAKRRFIAGDDDDYYDDDYDDDEASRSIPSDARAASAARAASDARATASAAAEAEAARAQHYREARRGARTAAAGVPSPASEPNDLFAQIKLGQSNLKGKTKQSQILDAIEEMEAAAAAKEEEEQRRKAAKGLKEKLREQMLAAKERNESEGASNEEWDGDGGNMKKYKRKKRSGMKKSRRKKRTSAKKNKHKKRTSAKKNKRKKRTNMKKNIR